MIRRPPLYTRTNTLFPDTALVRSRAGAQGLALGPAIKAVGGGRVAGLVSGHGARPSRAARHTASVRIAPAFAGALRIVTETPPSTFRLGPYAPIRRRRRSTAGRNGHRRRSGERPAG